MARLVHHLSPRREDIRPLAKYFLSRHATTMHLKPPTLSEKAVERLEAYDWPGNVRELENYLARALILSRGRVSVLTDLPGMDRGSPRTNAPGSQEKVARFDDSVKSLLGQALEATGGKIYGPSGAAGLLGLKPTTLQGKLRRYGIK